ncbi:biotin/lipoyl-binding protein [Candidatus Enterococcus mansonii]
MKKKVAIILVGIVIVLMLIVFFVVKNKKNKNVVQWTTYTIRKPEDLILSGKVVSKAEQRVQYNSLLGEITKVNVVNGAQVKAGDVLLTYSSQSNQNSLKEKQALQAQYTTNITNLENDLFLANEKLTKAKNENNDTDKQNAETEINSLETSLTTYRDQLTDINAQISTLENTSETVVTANFDGKAKVDETAKSDNSKPVIVLYSNDLLIDTSVTEYDVEKLKSDQEVTVASTNQSRQVSGKINFVGTIPVSEDTVVSNYKVQATLNEPIPLGYSVQVKVPQNEVNVPAKVVLDDKDQKYVFKYVKGKASKTKVKAEVMDGYTRITEGLQIGDKVIENPKGVKDNMDVNVK